MSEFTFAAPRAKTKQSGKGRAPDKKADAFASALLGAGQNLTPDQEINVTPQMREFAKGRKGDYKSSLPTINKRIRKQKLTLATRKNGKEIVLQRYIAKKKNN